MRKSVSHKDGLNFAAAFERAMGYAADSIALFALWNALWLALRREQFPSAFKKYSPFFEYLPAMILYELVLSLFKSLEEGDERPSVLRVLSLAQNAGIIDRDERKALKTKVNEVKPIWLNLREFRNEAIAHGNVSQIETTLGHAHLSGEDFQTIAFVNVEVLNVIAKKAGRNRLDAIAVARKHHANTLRLLRRLDR